MQLQHAAADAQSRKKELLAVEDSISALNAEGLQHLRSGALSNGHKCFKRARKLISAHSDVSVDLKATVTKNTALLYKRAGVFDRAAELFRMAAEMEDGVANAPRRSTSLLLAASAYAAHGHYAATSECAMQALLTTTATLFLPCQRRPEISQLSDLEAARVIVLSHYHLGTSQQRLGNVDGSKDCKYALEMAARFFGQGSTVYHGMYSAILADGRLRDLVNGHTLAPPPLQSDAMWSTNAGALFDGSLGFGGGVSRSTAAMLGADVTRNAFGDSALASAAVASSEKETLDIRNILSNPLPPLPSDVDFVRSKASLASTGALRAQFQLLC